MRRSIVLLGFILTSVHPAIAQVVELRGTAALPFASPDCATQRHKPLRCLQPQPAVRADAIQRATANALDRYVAAAGAATQANYERVRDQVLGRLSDFILSTMVLSEFADSGTGMLTVVVRAELNGPRFDQAMQAASPISHTTEGDRSTVAFVFMARRFASTAISDPERRTESTRDASTTATLVDRGVSQGTKDRSESMSTTEQSRGHATDSLTSAVVTASAQASRRATSLDSSGRDSSTERSAASAWRSANAATRVTRSDTTRGSLGTVPNSKELHQGSESPTITDRSSRAAQDGSADSSSRDGKLSQRSGQIHSARALSDDRSDTGQSQQASATTRSSSGSTDQQRKSTSTESTRDTLAADRTTTTTEGSSLATRTAGTTTRYADEVEYEVSSSEEINTAMSGVLSGAGFDVSDAEFIDVVTPEGSLLLNLRTDFGNGSDLASGTLRQLLAAASAAGAQYLAFGTLDEGASAMDSVSGLRRIYATVSGKILDIRSRLPRTIAAVGPEQFAGTGPDDQVAGRNALRIAAETTAREIVARLNARGIH